MSEGAYRIEVMHGVNLDMLGRRDAEHYGRLTLSELQLQIEGFAEELGMGASFFQTNAESEFVERLHRLGGEADGVILNPGAWTHYSWAIHDALQIAALPAVEVHLSDINAREAWRRTSVIGELCLTTVLGKGADGYRLALARLLQELDGAGR